MRIRIEEFPRHLERGLRPFYVLCGEETLLLEECLDQLRAAARTQGFADREVFHADPGFDWTRLAAACAGMSLFGDRKLIELRVPSGRPGNDGAAALRELAGRPSPDTVVAVVLGKTERGVDKAAWFKSLEEAGASVRAWPVKRNELPRWIGQRLRAAGFRPQADAVALLAERVEGNLLAARQEIDKLQLLAEPGSVLDARALIALVTDSARFGAFDLCDRALEGDGSAAARTLLGLRAEAEELPMVLGAFASELRRLLARAQGVAPPRGPARERPHDAAALKRLGHYGLESLLARAALVDRCIKGLEKRDPWDEMMGLVIAAAGSPR